MKKTIIHASLALTLLISIPHSLVSAPAAKTATTQTGQPKKETQQCTPANSKKEVTHHAKGTVEHVTSLNTFKEKISKGNVVVKFGAEWCPPCKNFEPVLDGVAQEFPHVTVISIDIDESPDIKNAYYSGPIPTTIFYKDGKEVSRKTGFRSKKEFSQEIKTTFPR